MNLNDYVKKYNYTFKEQKANEIDYLVLALLSYLNLKGIVSNNKKEKITISAMADKFFAKYPKIDFKNEIMAKRVTTRLLKLLKESNRFKDLLVYNYKYIGDNTTQFGALTIETNDFIYISYEGTDELISAWKEDFMFAYMFPVPAHNLAKDYLKSYTFSSKKLIIGGHSKGGNLALVSSMMSNPLLRSRIKNIYSFDGPGLRIKELESPKYQKIKNKLIHIIPNTSLIGILLRHENDIVIKSNAITFVSHLPLTWEIDNDKFIKTNLSKSSTILNNGLIKWLDKYSYEQRELFVKELFKLFEESDISSLNEFKIEAKKAINFLKNISNVDGIVKDMSFDLISIIKNSIIQKD